MNTWLQHVEDWKDCQRCPLGTQRDRICLARGVLPCDVLFVGEAPGASEDTAGLPFVGPAGMLLDEIIARGVPKGVTHALTNLVACFPREAKSIGDNEPERGEILECRPRLVQFVNLAQPRVIVRVGKLAVRYLGFDLSVPFADIDHPAYMLRLPLAAQKGAVQRAMVHIRNTCEDVLDTSRAEWKPWGMKHAGVEAQSDNIPF